MKKLLVLCPLLFPFSLAAQTWLYQHDTSIKVYAYGQQQSMPWCDGFNSPAFTMGDLNNDGKQDLVVYESYNSVRTFINTGTAGNPHYTYAPEYEVNFPAIYDYLILADYNHDGIPDLFQQGQYGFAVYRGYYNSSNQLCFHFYENLFYPDTADATGWANAFCNPGVIPSIVDVDGDGDLDFVVYDILGGWINYYKNMQVELGLPADSIHIVLGSTQWGDFYDTLGHTNDASLCLFDYDMDGDYDCLVGGLGSNKMNLYINGRIPYDPTGPDSMVAEDTSWQQGGTVIDISDWPVAFNIDINQDGKKDLLITSNFGPSAMNYNNVWYYENLSTPGNPNWQFKSDSFIVDQSIDLGTAGYPTLFNYSKEGKPDMFIGSDGYRQPDGTLKSRISYYKNTSTTGSPSFTLQTNDFMSLSTYGWAGTAPAFGDIDNDGKSDMVIGHTDGTLSYFKNMAASESVTPDWVMVAQAMTDENGDTINVGGYAAPVIYDVDKDGKPDLVIGNYDGTLYYYRNVTTTPGVISLKLVNTDLGQVKVEPTLSFGNYSTPFIGKIDTSGTDYLLVGSSSGLIWEYTGFQSGDTAGVYSLLSSSYSHIDTMHSLYYDDQILGGANGIYDGLRSAPVVGDIAGDGSLYMIVGNVNGGAELYKAGLSYLSVPTITVNAGQINVYPNPATTMLIIQSAVEPINAISISNILGQTVVSRQYAGGKLQTVDVSALAAGVYFVKVNGSMVRKFVKE